MIELKSPEGMIPVEDFAKRKGLAPEKAVKMIRDGFYVGRIVGEQWFVDPSELSINNAIATQHGSGALYRSEYATARKVAMFISVTGWVVFAAGIIAVMVGMDSGLRTGFGIGYSLVASVSGLTVAGSGLFLVAAGQVTRAMVDSADHTREILRHLIERD